MEKEATTLSNIIQTIDNLVLLNGLYFLTKQLLSLGLRCRYFTLSNIVILDSGEFKIKDRRSLRINHILLEPSSHPDWVDDLDSYFDRLGMDLERVGKADVYSNLLVVTMRHLENKP